MLMRTFIFAAGIMLAAAAASIIPAAKIKVLISMVGAVAYPLSPQLQTRRLPAAFPEGMRAFARPGLSLDSTLRDERDSVESRPCISKSGRTLGAPAYLSFRVGRLTLPPAQIFLMLASLEAHIRRRSELQRRTKFA